MAKYVLRSVEKGPKRNAAVAATAHGQGLSVANERSAELGDPRMAQPETPEQLAELGEHRVARPETAEQ